MEPHLRSLGMPTMLVNGVIQLASPYTICKKGATLTPEQAHLLKHFGFHLAEFHIIPKYYYHDEVYTTIE
ncbi:mRNA turnover and ribosome assembly protein [Batrachochytrium dendrobatidis]